MRRLLPAALAIVAIVVSGALVSHAGTTFSGGGGGVASTRAINTTSPVAGGGDLSADRTITFSNTYVDPSINGFRVSLTSLTPVTTADVASGTALYLVTYTSDRMSIWDGSEWDVLTTSTEPVIYLTGLTAETNYDVFAMSSAGSVTIDATVVAWTNSTTHTLDEQDGVRTKSGDRTRRWIACFRATGASATDDTAYARHLWNASNRVPRRIEYEETTGSWTYQLGTWRAARGVDTNRFTFIRGLNIEPVVAFVAVRVENNTAGTAVDAGLALNRSTGSDSIHTAISDLPTGSDVLQIYGHYMGHPVAGSHGLVWVEWSQAVGTTTWYGSSNNGGIYGTIVN